MFLLYSSRATSKRTILERNIAAVRSKMAGYMEEFGYDYM